MMVRCVDFGRCLRRVCPSYCPTHGNCPGGSCSLWCASEDACRGERACGATRATKVRSGSASVLARASLLVRPARPFRNSSTASRVSSPAVMRCIRQCARSLKSRGPVSALRRVLSSRPAVACLAGCRPCPQARNVQHRTYNCIAPARHNQPPPHTRSIISRPERQCRALPAGLKSRAVAVG